MARAAVADACEGQNLDLVEHILSQACELGTAGRVAFYQPEPGLGVRVLLLVSHLPLPTQRASVWSLFPERVGDGAGTLGPLEGLGSKGSVAKLLFLEGLRHMGRLSCIVRSPHRPTSESDLLKATE